MGFEVLQDYLRPYYLKWFYQRIRPESRAAYLSDCWSKPHFPLSAQLLSTKLREVIAHDPAKPDLLFLPMSDWHARIQRSQHLAMNFGEMGNRCFFLNPHLGREFPQPYSSRNDVRVSLIAPQTLEIHLHLPREPVYHHRLLTPGETGRIVSGIRRLVEAAGVTRLIQLVSFPLWAQAALELKREFGFPIVYDCHDQLGGFKAISPDVVAAEPQLIESADLVCFTSQWLFDEAVRQHPGIAGKSIVARNGVNPQDYGVARSAARSGKPTIGYAGSLNFWFDVEAVRLAATRHPDWNFVLIGRVESAQILGLKALPNVLLEGEVPYAELPLRMSAFDVAIIPFLKSPLTLATNPLKLYEYFRLGFPVVSTRLPEIEAFHDLVYFYESPEDFVRQIELAFAENDPALRARRKAAGDDNSWRARCEQLAQRFKLLPAVS